MSISDEDISALLDEEILARRTKAMFLRNAGATLTKIAEETGVSVATVRKDLAIVRRDINNEQPTDVIARHRAVIFDIQRANYPAMMRGDKDAAATILRALDREAKLLGLDAPTRILAGVSDVEFANEAARLIQRIQALDPDTMKELERAHASGPTVIDADVEPDPADQPRGQAAGAQPAQPEVGPSPGAGGVPQTAEPDRRLRSADADTTAAAPDGGGADDTGHDAGLPAAGPDDDWSNI